MRSINNTIKNIAHIKEVNKEKGITLIALVITIVVLLILAAVSIAMLAGENGILGKAGKAVEEHTEKAALEKLKLKLTEYIINQNDNAKPNLKEYIEAIEGCTETREDDAEDNIGGYVAVIDGYEFRVTAKGEFLESLGKTTSPIIVLKQDGKNIMVSITERGESIVELKVLDSTNNVIKSVAKEEITKEEQNYVFNYSFDLDGTYSIKITTQEGKEYIKKVIIDLTPPTTPEISSNYGYPILTENGVIQDGTTKIIYDTSDNIENYYSLDGSNWVKYTGEFQYAQQGKIYAKSIKKSNGTESTANKEITIPSDALGELAYDGIDSTKVTMPSGLGGNHGKIKISPSMIGRQIRVKITSNSGEAGTVYVRDSSGNILDSYSIKDAIINISEGADYLSFYRNNFVYEVSPYNP